VPIEVNDLIRPAFRRGCLQLGAQRILEALADAVPRARAHLRQLLSGWGQPELGPDASVVVSELVTNSVAASAGLRLAAALVLVWLGSDSDRVLLAVADASPCPPVRLSLEPDAEGGRGLALVETLRGAVASRPGATGDRDHAGPVGSR